MSISPVRIVPTTNRAELLRKAMLPKHHHWQTSPLACFEACSPHGDREGLGATSGPSRGGLLGAVSFASPFPNAPTGTVIQSSTILGKYKDTTQFG